MGKLFGFLISLLVLLGAVLAGVGFYGSYLYSKPGPATADGKPRIVAVARGAATPAIATTLKRAGAIEDDFQFRTILRVLGFMPGGSVSLQAGEFDIPSGASMQKIVSILSTSKPNDYIVIIPEGLTSAMIVDLLDNESWNTTNKDWKPTEEEVAAQRAAFDKLPPEQKATRRFREKWGRSIELEGPRPAVPEEGSMLPGGYHVARGATIESVIKRAQDAQEKLMAELWPRRQEGLPKELKTPRDAIILASIVENETGIASERPQVAALFINRLRRPMRLESDPTVVYGLTKGVPLGHGLRVSELATKHPWNTYHIDGLPQTPICNPGRESIEAVLNPPQSKYLFFVADGSGGHVFAETYAEHLRNVAEWRRVEAQGGTRTPASGYR